MQRAWQIDAAKVAVPSTGSDNYLNTLITPALVHFVMTNLGLPTNALAVEAHLYKLLLYEPGGHLKKHRDPEQETGVVLFIL